MKTIWVYTFEDGTILRLLGIGLTAEEVFKLQEIHGKAKIKCVRE